MSGKQLGRRVRSAEAHVLVVDRNRSRRHLLARAFRAAGCEVVEATGESEVTRTLAIGAQSWVLAVADYALTVAYCDAHPSVPVLQLGNRHVTTIAGRVTLAATPELSAQVHGLVDTGSGRI